MKTFRELLIELYACEEAREWASDMPIEEIVETCQRGDWLYWLAKKISIDKHKLTLTVDNLATYYSDYYGAYANAVVDNAAKAQNLMQTADICRKYIGQEIINKVNELLRS